MHVIIHRILESRHECILVNGIKRNPIVCDHLNSDVAFDEIDLATDVAEAEVLLP